MRRQMSQFSQIKEYGGEMLKKMCKTSLCENIKH